MFLLESTWLALAVGATEHGPLLGVMALSCLRPFPVTAEGRRRSAVPG